MTRSDEAEEWRRLRDAQRATERSIAVYEATLGRPYVGDDWVSSPSDLEEARAALAAELEAEARSVRNQVREMMVLAADIVIVAAGIIAVLIVAGWLTASAWRALT